MRNYGFVYGKETITDVLNLIQKQHKEIEIQKGFRTVLIEDKDNLNKEIEEKDKIIDEMAKYISELDIDEDICMKNIANTELCNEQYSNCKECIKQYYKKKASEEQC